MIDVVRERRNKQGSRGKRVEQDTEVHDHRELQQEQDRDRRKGREPCRAYDAVRGDDSDGVGETAEHASAGAGLD